jgi:simple sugar transport system permease protein
MTDWPHSVALPLLLLSGAIAGAASGGFCGWLKVRRGTNEVISTIMMNFIALELVSWAVHGPLIEASHAYPESDPVAVAATFSTFMPPSRLNSGILLAVVLALAAHLVIYRTDYGFRLRAFGQNRRASAFFGIAPTPATIVALAVSGAFAGLGGAVQLAAINHRLFEHFSPGWGFEGIAVALVARLNPAAVVGSALFFGALDNGAQAMQRSSGISPVFVQVVQGLIIFILLALDATGLGQTPKLLSASEPETPSAAEISRAANA